MQEQTDKYDEIAQRANQLREKKEKVEQAKKTTTSSENNRLSHRTYITGLVNGKITDLEYSGNKVYLTVDLDTDETITVPVIDNKEYSDSNELARLLEWKNIPDGRIGDLLGESITLRTVTCYPEKTTEYSDLNWEVYIPNNLDFFGKTYFTASSTLRRVGVQGAYEKIQNLNDDEKLPITALWFFGVIIYFAIISAFFMPLMWNSLSLFATVVLTVALSIPITTNYARHAKVKYDKYRTKESI